MKVLLLPSWYPPDGGKFFRDQAKELLRHGNEVDVLYIKNHRQKNFGFFKNDFHIADEDGLTVVRSCFVNFFGFSAIYPLLYAEACLHAFRRYVRMVGLPDIIHVHSSVWAGYAAYCIRRRYRIPYVITEHRGRFTLMTKEAQKQVSVWYPLYLKPAFRYASGVILVGSHLEHGLGRYKVTPVTWTTISNGVNTSFFVPGEVSPQLEFTFICVAGLVALKGHKTLLSGFRNVNNLIPSTRLVIVGDGPERASLENFCERYGMQEAVIFRGHLDPSGVRDAFQAADVFVLPTRYDAQGIVYLEAMSCGLPIIYTEGAPPELCPKFAGIRIPIDDSGALECAMIQLYKDYDKIDRKRIREFAVDNYDFSKIVRQISDFYDKVLDSMNTNVPE